MKKVDLSNVRDLTWVHRDCPFLGVRAKLQKEQADTSMVLLAAKPFGW
jgi:hypothetical protein